MGLNGPGGFVAASLDAAGAGAGAFAGGGSGLVGAGGAGSGTTGISGGFGCSALAGGAGEVVLGASSGDLVAGQPASRSIAPAIMAATAIAERENCVFIMQSLSVLLPAHEGLILRRGKRL